MVAGQNDKNEEDDQIKAAKKAASDLEIKLVLPLSRHGITSNYLDCLAPILKENLPESDTLKQMQLSREKGHYLVSHGLAPTFQEETITKLKTCDAFVMAFDETAINRREEMEIVVCILEDE